MNKIAFFYQILQLLRIHFLKRSTIKKLDSDSLNLENLKVGNLIIRQLQNLTSEK